MGYRPRAAPRECHRDTEAAYEEAYRRWSSGQSYREVWVAMAGAPHWCGAKSTAADWVRKGRALAHDDTDPMNGRGAQRDAVGETLRDYRVRLAADVHAGRLARDAGFRFELEAIRLYVHTLGLRAAPDAAKVDLGGAGVVGLPVELFEALAAIPHAEFLPPDEGEPEQ